MTEANAIELLPDARRDDWWKLPPDAKYEFPIGGFGEWKIANNAVAALADHGPCGMVYLPDFPGRGNNTADEPDWWLVFTASYDL